MTSSRRSSQDQAWKNGAEEINSCDYLFVDWIGESAELTFEVLLREAKPQATITTIQSDDAVGELLLGSRPIETDESCRHFRVEFGGDIMVSYGVLNESFGKYPELPEQFTGKLFREFSRSHLLDFTRSTTIVSDRYPGKLSHYQIACQNHIIDVNATGPPSIDSITAHETAARALSNFGGSQPDLQDIPRRRTS